MSSQSDWSLDYCLCCDKQTTGGIYCSHACRLADLDAVRPSTASTQPLTLRSTSSWSGFILPPAFDFASSRSKSKTTCNSPVIEFEPIFGGTQTKRSSVSSFADSTSSTPPRPSVDHSVRDYIQRTSLVNNTISRESKEELRRYEGLFVKSVRQQQSLGR